MSELGASNIFPRPTHSENRKENNNSIRAQGETEAEASTKLVPKKPTEGGCGGHPAALTPDWPLSCFFLPLTALPKPHLV